jgi:molybdopterin-synthase adenylyltransferase
MFGSSFSTLVTEVLGGACARVGAAPVRSASAKMTRNPLATPDFMFPFAQTKGSTAALPALSTLALSCSLAGASAVPVGTVPFVNDSLQEKYSRQMLFAGIGPEGQQRLLASRAAIIGCGAIGAATANLLVRAGVGYIRIIDRDFVEPSNLQRQTLFDESDALNVLPKAVAAERKLRSINSGVAVEGVVADLSPRNAEALLGGVDLLLDGTDNFETRFLINDVAVKSSRPWIYAAGVASYGLTMTIRPGATACLACLLETGSAAQGLEETCDTIGVLGPIVNLIASLQAAEALKLLSGHPEALHGRLLSCNVWTGRMQSIGVARNPECRACARRNFTYLGGEAQPRITMCGRDSVQIHERTRALDLGVLGLRLKPLVEDVRQNDFLLRFRIAPYEMTVFADGRAILKGTKDPAVARSLYARYIGA